ncbi:MAG: S-ribosylhomocysteine lyase [Acholeplasmatales bacterium]|jgi:S-ribosylhomocysteine lyase|nr:S-ribosylhomocysteine lyase [Acholeplasmatales bacterium]
MQTIASFTVDHNLLNPGIYISRIDGDITTYDIRIFKPNCNKYLHPKVSHTLEHLLATILRNDKIIGKKIIYVGPMGCLTGMYLLVRNSVHLEVISKLQEAFKIISTWDKTIPGYSKKECGNYKFHNLKKTKKVSLLYLEVIKNTTPSDLYYKK